MNLNDRIKNAEENSDKQLVLWLTELKQRRKYTKELVDEIMKLKRSG